MNDRLISAEKLLTKYQELCDGLACIDCPFFGLDNKCGLEIMILQEQIVDAVEVVRCKDCKYFGRLDPEIYCYMLGANKTIGFSEDGYCSWGKRREDAKIN